LSVLVIAGMNLSGTLTMRIARETCVLYNFKIGLQEDDCKMQVVTVFRNTLVETRAVGRPWRERPLPRAPFFRECKN